MQRCARLADVCRTPWLLNGFVLVTLALAAPAARAFDFTQIFSPNNGSVIPVPLIGIDPESGTTLGLIGAWLHHDAIGSIDRIVAPDVLHNSYFGWGLRGRVLAFPSSDTSWTVIAGAKQRVEHKFELDYQSGITRSEIFSFSFSAIDERTGTSRFFGFGNETLLDAQTDYTAEHMLLQGMVGWNISRLWQLAYLAHFRNEDVTMGLLPDLPSIATLFPNVPGLGTSHELLNRLMLIYDSRDSTVIPSRGVETVIYGGLSSRGGLLNDSLYDEVGLDARGFVPFGSRTVLAMHTAVHLLPTSQRLPFWAYSTIGGDQSEIGGPQPLRGFGEDRFTDVDSLSASVELRRIISAMHIFATRIDLELAPFVDIGRVFPNLHTSPLTQLHRVYGFGVRAIARPFIVAYVDVGYGTEGSAAFSGINYIF
jgi:outer membrane protein assembly factor BamA